MTERPILFSGPMVRAILDGRKTQTRRVAMHTVCGVRVARLANDPSPEVATCPYGAPGDRLWVREAWRKRSLLGVDSLGNEVDEELIEFRVDGHGDGQPWRPSIFMPRSASRITLTIADVRVERLQEISRGDAMAEGCPFPNMADGDDPRRWYRDLWDSLNASRGFEWDANPWVWVVTFERVPASC